MLTMEFLSHSLEDRGSIFLDGMEVPIDGLARNKKIVNNLEMKDLCDFDKNMLSLDIETVDGIGLLETVFPKSVLGSACLGVSSEEMRDSLINKEPSTSMINLDHFKQELGLAAEHSVTGFETNNEKESVFDLQLEKYTDSKEVSSKLSSEESMVSSLVEDSVPAKRARTTNLYPHPQIPICQVQGCYKDLSSSKDYHKRHRVCDIHSKTAKVIINGIEQRFCQQCSRFHLLSEFDDGKRSCRKRLAGHNKRRRKPQFGALGSRFFKLTLLKSASFLSPEILSGGFLYQENNMTYNHHKHLKLESVPVDVSELSVPDNGKPPQKSLANLHTIRNQPHSGTCNDATVDSAVPCALSLLSAKSHEPSSHSTGFSMMNSPSTRETQGTYIRNDQKSTTRLRKSNIKSLACNEGLSSRIGNQAGIPMVHDSSAAASSVVQKDGFLQTSDYDDYIRCISPELESTVDLLQLSSHFQRVEQLRNSMQ